MISEFIHDLFGTSAINRKLPQCCWRLVATSCSPLINILETNSKRLRANTASALSAIARGSRRNQDLIASIPGTVKGLVSLVNSKNSACQVKAASAIESLAQGNVNVQRLVEDAGAVRPLIRLLKIWSIEVKEQGTYCGEFTYAN